MRRGLSKEQIMQIAKSKGYFHCSLNFRDGNTRRKCQQLVKEGLLFKRSRFARDATMYYVSREAASK